KQVDFREVGLREGMQSHGLVVPTQTKVDYFNSLREAGCTELNVVSFSHPKTMPQVADAEVFLRSLGSLRDGAVLSGLVPNSKALDRAIAMREEGLLDMIFLVFAESRATLAANGMTAGHEELIAQIEASAARARAAG